MKKLLIIFGFIVLFSIPAFSQCPVMPVGFICITQAQANVAASNARELPAVKEKVVVLEASLVEKDKSIAEVKATAAKNIADITQALHNTEVQLASASGSLTECKADKLLYAPLIEYLTKNQRSKQTGLINIKLGGN